MAVVVMANDSSIYEEVPGMKTLQPVANQQAITSFVPCSKRKLVTNGKSRVTAKNKTSHSGSESHHTPVNSGLPSTGVKRKLQLDDQVIGLLN